MSPLFEHIQDIERQITSLPQQGVLYPLCQLLHAGCACFASVDAFYVCLYRHVEQTLIFPYNFDGELYDEPVIVPLGQGPTSWVIHHNAPFVLNDETEVLHAGGIYFGDVSRVSCSAIHVPIQSSFADKGHPVLGVISAQSYRPNAYTDETVAMMQWMAGRAGFVLEKERASAEWQRRAEAADALAAERWQQMICMVDAFVGMSKQVSQAADAVRTVTPPGNARLTQAVDQLCQTCYRTQTEASQLPFAMTQKQPESDHSLPHAAIASLTPRERELLCLIGSGISNKEIARQLFISTDTVKFHCGNLYRKLSISSRTQAIKIVSDYRLQPNTTTLSGR